MAYKTLVVVPTIVIGLFLTISDARATAFSSASVSASGLTFSPASGSLVVIDPATGNPTTQAPFSSGSLPFVPTAASSGNVFDNFGSNGSFNFGTANSPVAASASSPAGYAFGSGSVAGTSLGANSLTNISGGIIFAGDTLPGASADFGTDGLGSFGAFAFDPSNPPGCNPCSVTFSVSLKVDQLEQANANGFVDQNEVTLTLTLFSSAFASGAETVLFFDNPLAPLTDGMLAFSSAPTLTNSIDLDPTQVYSFDLNITAETEAHNVPEPASLSLLPAVAVAWWRRRQRARRSYKGVFS
jgi:hypothetical protein